MAEYREVVINENPIVSCLACEECGAYVWRIDLHDDWHEGQVLEFQTIMAILKMKEAVD